MKKEVLKTTFMPVKGISNVEIVFRDQDTFTSCGLDLGRRIAFKNVSRLLRYAFCIFFLNFHLICKLNNPKRAKNMFVCAKNNV